MNNRFWNFCMLTLFLSVPFFVQAQSASFQKVQNTAAFEAKVTKMATTTNTIESDFVQEKHLSFMSENIESSGHFTFKKDNLLRWSYSAPFEYLIVLNGSKVLIQDNGRVSEYDMEANKIFRDINDMMLELVQGKVFDNPRYAMSHFENTSSYLTKLTPVSKEMQGYVEEIHIYFDKKDGAVNSIKMVESGGDYTLITFTNRKLNIAVSDEKFVID